MAREVARDELIDRCNKFAGTLSSVAKQFRELMDTMTPEDPNIETLRRTVRDLGDAFYEMSDFWMELYTYALDVYGD